MVHPAVLENRIPRKHSSDPRALFLFHVFKTIII